MASSSRKRKRERYSFDLSFATLEEKEAFLKRLQNVRKLMTPAGASLLVNQDLVYALLDLAESGSHPTSDPHSANAGPATKSFMRNGGIYTDGASSEEQSFFIAERLCFSDLVEGLSTQCPCGVTSAPWVLESVVQKGHAIRALFCCRRCKQQRRTWSSSRVLAGHYVVNQKMVHAFTCAGMLPSQYIHLSTFSGIGVVGHAYIRRVYQKLGYIELVGRAAELSMQSCVEEVQALPEYSTKGEWVITDARHDSTANAYHTTVPCLSGSTHKIIGISTISRVDHATAQTRELACTKVVLPQVIGRGLRVVEVAHDIQAQVSKYVKETLGLVNSYDTWHGTKNVAREMKKITEGPKKERGKKWFPQLVDKRRSVKIHLYWAMKNCGDSPSKLQELILNIPCHYQGQHSKCPATSPCHTPAYTPSKIKLDNDKAIESLCQQLKSTYIYRSAEDFCRCRDTYMVESFNHQLLTYLPKRIHFSTVTFKMRMNLAVLDWNENVNRSYTSASKVKDLRRPDRRTPMKVLVRKKYNFVELLWAMFVTHNQVDLMEVDEDDDDEGGGESREEFEDGEELPPESDSDDSEDEG